MATCWSSDVCSSDLSIAVDSPGPDRLLYGSQVKDRVNAALNELSAQERTAFVLRHFEGQSIQEIGEALGRSEERRVGKECRSRRGRDREKKKRGEWEGFFFSSRRRHTRWPRAGVQTCALPICPLRLTARGRTGFYTAAR